MLPFSTPQINNWSSNWIKFYGEHRLGYQLELARGQYGDSTIYEKGTCVFIKEVFLSTVAGPTERF